MDLLDRHIETGTEMVIVICFNWYKNNDSCIKCHGDSPLSLLRQEFVGYFK